MFATADIFLFEGFRLDRQGEGLLRRNERGVFVPVSIGLRALDVLSVLVERSGSLVPKRDYSGRLGTDGGRECESDGPDRRPPSRARRGAGGRKLHSDRRRSRLSLCDAGEAHRARHPGADGRHHAERGRLRLCPALPCGRGPAFANLSDDPQQDYFADGITDDLTTDLSWTPEFFVISRSAAFVYKGKSVDAKQIGREVGVDYVVEGSLRATGSRLQVNAQLIDAETGAHVWADRFETDGNDLSAAEAEITGRLLWDLRLNLFAAASSRAEQDGRSDGNAKTIAMRGWSVFHRPRSAANIQEALQLWERALEIDPRSMSAKIGIALALVSNFWHGWSRSFEPDEARAERLLLEVFAVDPTDITARIAMGILRRLRGRLDESRIELESVPALDRNIAGLRQLGATLVYLGQPEPAIQHLERSIRLSPYEANIGLNYAYVGLCHLLLGHLDKALNHLRMARTSNPRIYIVHLYLAAALGLNGDFDDARTALAEGIRLKPEVDSLVAWRTYRPWEADPRYLALRAQTLDVGLHRAGFPVEAAPPGTHPLAVSVTAGPRAG